MRAFRGVSFKRTSVCRFACPPRPDAAGFGAVGLTLRPRGQAFLSKA